MRTRGAPPPAMVDGVRARIAPLFPTWDPERIEELVRQIAAVEWRYVAAAGCAVHGAGSSLESSPTRRQA